MRGLHGKYPWKGNRRQRGCSWSLDSSISREIPTSSRNPGPRGQESLVQTSCAQVLLEDKNTGDHRILGIVKIFWWTNLILRPPFHMRLWIWFGVAFSKCQRRSHWHIIRILALDWLMIWLHQCRSQVSEGLEIFQCEHVPEEPCFCEGLHWSCGYRSIPVSHSESELTYCESLCVSFAKNSMLKRIFSA